MSENSNTVAVQMTAEEKAQFEAFRKEKARKEAEEKAKKMREDYAQMVDAEISAIMPELISVSGDIAAVKRRAYDNFKAIIEMKAEMFRLKKGEELEVKSHTFTNSKGTMRITLGAYQIDNYQDTAEEGVAIVKEYISSLAKDPESESLVKMVLSLLAKDAKGTLKASRIVRLRKLADESGNERFQEGVKIIEEAYNPITSKMYVKAEVRGENGEWKSVPLGMTES